MTRAQRFGDLAVKGLLLYVVCSFFFYCAFIGAERSKQMALQEVSPICKVYPYRCVDGRLP